LAAGKVSEMLYRQLQSILEKIGTAFSFAKAKKERDREFSSMMVGKGGERESVN